MLKQLYQTVMPNSIRIPLWHLRSHPWPSIRWATATSMVAIGKPTARVNVNGVRLQVDLRDTGVGLPLYVDRSYEADESVFIKSALREGMCFVDIGANLGYFTTLASQAVGKGGQVVSIEPDPYNYRLLQGNVHNNCLGNVSLHNLALGASPGTGMLSLSTCNLGDHRLYGPDNSRQRVPVQIETLDRLLVSLGLRPNVIKMDVQGFEYYVTQGMRNILEDRRPLVIMTEFWPHGLRESGASPREFFELMELFGFKPSALLPNGNTQDITFEAVEEKLSARKTPDELKDAWMNLIFHR
jgi:FkbM family methyltransferase